MERRLAAAIPTAPRTACDLPPARGSEATAAARTHAATAVVCVCVRARVSVGERQGASSPQRRARACPQRREHPERSISRSSIQLRPVEWGRPHYILFVVSFFHVSSHATTAG